MCEIKKILFSVSEQGNPLAQLWVDDADVDKNSDCIYIALKSQVAYLLFSELGAKITLKKSKSEHTSIKYHYLHINYNKKKNINKLTIYIH